MAFLHGCAEGREKPSGSTDWISRRVNAEILRFVQNKKGNPVGTEAALPPEYSPRRNALCMSGDRAKRGRLDSKGLSSFNLVTAPLGHEVVF